MRGIIAYTLLTALRDRMLVGIIALQLLAVMLAYFASATALLEEMEMARALAAGSLRLISAVGIIIFVCFHVRTLVSDKELLLLLSRPISRPTFIAGYASGLIVLMSILVVWAGLLLLVLQPASWAGYGYWLASLWAEGLLLILFALAAALMLRSTVSACLAGFAFYLLSRSMILLVITSESGLSKFNNWFDMIGPSVIRYGSYVVPRLDLFARSEWLNYPLAQMSSGAGGIAIHEISWLIAAQTLVYGALLLGLAILDFRQKEV